MIHYRAAERNGHRGDDGKCSLYGAGRIVRDIAGADQRAFQYHSLHRIFSALNVISAVNFATSPSQSTVIYVMITLLVTHLVNSNVLLPLVVGSKVRINALITVLGGIIGDQIWGIPGMFLPIPIVAVLKIIFDQVESLNTGA